MRPSRSDRERKWKDKYLDTFYFTRETKQIKAEREAIQL
jgi:hypothetical protein